MFTTKYNPIISSRENIRQRRKKSCRLADRKKYNRHLEEAIIYLLLNIDDKWIYCRRQVEYLRRKCTQAVQGFMPGKMRTGHTLKLPSPTKLARQGHFPAPSQTGRLAGAVFYTTVYLFSGFRIRYEPPLSLSLWPWQTYICHYFAGICLSCVQCNSEETQLCIRHFGQPKTL